DFPNGGGRLCVDFKPRLLKSPTASLPTAYYIQPANEINRTSYFTLVDLTSVGEGKWHGWIQPLEAKLSLYLSIQPAADGSLNGILGNPELNLFHGKSYNVELCSDTVMFSDTKIPRPDSKDNSIKRPSYWRFDCRTSIKRSNLNARNRRKRPVSFRG